MAELIGDHIVRHLDLAGSVIMKKPLAGGGGDNPSRRGFERKWYRPNIRVRLGIPFGESECESGACVQEYPSLRVMQTAHQTVGY
jgi:hypothetical protein